jgi:cytochrome c oxidase subunit 4
MTSETQMQRHRTASSLWRRNGLVWAALMVLLFLSLILAYVPMGIFTPMSGIIIAFIKAGLVVALFMELVRSRPVDRLAALAGMMFLVVMFGLTMTDVLWRLLVRN